MGVKRKIAVFMVMMLMTGVWSGCGDKEEPVAKEPDIMQVRNICNLATVKCYYHNVAISEKEATNWFAKDRKFWIEYTGVANLGIDMTKVEMKIDGENIQVTIPPAKLLTISIDEQTLTDDSYMTSQDGLIRNEITADDQTAAINKAQKEMEQEVKENSALLLSAQNRAKTLIENYINQLGEASGVEYKIEWVYLKDDSMSEVSEPADTED